MDDHGWVPRAVVVGGVAVLVVVTLAVSCSGRPSAGWSTCPSRIVEVPDADHNDCALLDGPQLITAVVELAG